MFTVTAHAATTALTTLATLKQELKITTTVDDAWLTAQIDSASATICQYLGIERAEDGTRTIGRETLVETIDRRGYWPWISGFVPVVPTRETDAKLTLARRPVVSISSVVEGDTTLDASQYQLSAAVGTLKRLANSLPCAWGAALIVVTYTAGWLMPGDVGRNLPADYEEAAIATVKASWFARTRDPVLKSENIPGVRQVDYFFGVPGQSGALPDEALKKLQFDRSIHI